MGRLICLLFAATLALPVQAGELYRWMDAKGKVSYGDAPPPGSVLVESLTFADEAAADAGLPYETRRAMKNFPVTLYVSDDCPVCDEARELLNRRGVPFTEQPIRTQAEFDAYKAASGGDGVPTLLVGRKFVVGFSALRWQAELDYAGYPKSAPPRHQAPVPRPEPAPSAPADADTAAAETAAP